MRNLDFREHSPIDSEITSELCSALDLMLKKGLASEQRPGDARIFYFEKFVPKKYSEAFFDQHLAYCRSVNIQVPEFMTLMVNRTWFDPGGLGSGAGWHRDSGYQPQHKTFTYLCDVSHNNGPFVVRDKENLWLSFLNNPKTRIEEPLKFRFGWGENIDKTLTGHKGKCFSCCTNFIHRGMPVKSGERYMATVYAWNKLPPKAHREYFKKNA